MKAHLIISKNENNRRQVLNLLTYYIKKGCKNYTDKLKVYQNYDNPNFDKELYENKAGILLINNFPADLVSALKPRNERFTVVFTNANELKSVYGGGFTDYQVYQLPADDDDVKPKVLAKILYYEICFEIVSNTDWNEKTKVNLLEYYNQKIRKNLCDFLAYPTKKYHHIKINDMVKLNSLQSKNVAVNEQ